MKSGDEKVTVSDELFQWLKETAPKNPKTKLSKMSDGELRTFLKRMRDSDLTDDQIRKFVEGGLRPKSLWITIPIMLAIAAFFIGGFAAMIDSLGPDDPTDGPMNLLEAALDPTEGTKERFNSMRDTFGTRLPDYYSLDVSEVSATFNAETGKITGAVIEVSQKYGAKKIRGVMTAVCGGKSEDWTIDGDIQSGELVGTRCVVSYLAQGSYAWTIALEPVSGGDGVLP